MSEHGLYLTAEERAEIQEIVQSVREARAEKAKENQLTKEEIMAVKDIVKRQRLIRENMDLFR